MATSDGQETIRRLAAERLADAIPEALRGPLAALDRDDRRLAELILAPDQSLAPGTLC